MREKRNLFLMAAIVLLGFASCGRKLAPATDIDKKNKIFDSAAFNYVYVEAIRQKLLGNNGDALKYLEQCIKINPKSDASYYEMAQIVSAGGDGINAKHYLAKALSIDEQNYWYLMMLSGIYYQEKNLDSSIIYYEKAVKYYPEKENLQLTLGNLYTENRNFDKAKLIFDAIDSKYGINEPSTLAAIKSLMTAQKFDDAYIKVQLLLKEYPNEILYNGLLAEIYRGKGDNDKALEVYIQLIKKDPDNAQTQLSFCGFLISLKNYDELFTVLNSVIINDKILKEDKISLFAQLIEMPDLMKDKADKLLLSILVLEANYKDDDIILLLRPELLIKQMKLAEAASRLSDIIKGKEQNYYAWEKLLLVYLQMGDYINLFTKGEECATLFNTSFLAKVLYANGALENGKYSIAIEELRKAEILAGDNKENLLQVFTMRADVYYRMKDFSKAFEVFEQAKKTNNDDLTLLNNYAYYLAEQNINLKEAEEMAKKVIDREKDNATFLDTYAWVLYKRGKVNEAAHIMEGIISKSEKDDATLFEHYGYILKGQKKCTKAAEYWRIAIKMDSKKLNLEKEIENCEKYR
jgi:tetratricopeptide (TPR) repeat protein